jgi:hypothetical protein
MRLRLLQGIFVATVFLFASSCKKKSDDPGTSTNYFVKVKKNGNWVEYPTTAGELGPDLFNPALTDLGVSAQSASGDDRFDLTVQVSGSSFTPGTYTSGNQNYQVDISTLLQNGSGASHFDITDAAGMAPSSYTVNITSITADAITGNFTGNYIYNSFGTGASAVLAITEGEFHVKRIR